jgi:hypothetical protein
MGGLGRVEGEGGKSGGKGRGWREREMGEREEKRAEGGGEGRAGKHLAGGGADVGGGGGDSNGYFVVVGGGGGGPGGRWGLGIRVGF